MPPGEVGQRLRHSIPIQLSHSLWDNCLNVAVGQVKSAHRQAQFAAFHQFARQLQPAVFGQLIGAYMFIYGIARFFLEFLRDDPGRGLVFHGLMSLTQFISILVVIAGGVLWMRRNVPRPVMA